VPVAGNGRTLRHPGRGANRADPPART